MVEVPVSLRPADLDATRFLERDGLDEAHVNNKTNRKNMQLPSIYYM